MAEQAGARTEPASARRKAEARRKGQVPFSRDLSMALVLMAALGVLSLTSEATIQALLRILREWWSMAADPRSWSAATAEMLQAAMLKMGSDSLIILLPVLACVLVMATGATVAQTGLLWKQDAFGFDLSRISPIAGLQRLCSLRAVVELAKAGLKVVVVAVAGYLAIRTDVESLPLWVQRGVDHLLGATGWLLLSVSLWVGLALTALAVADYGYQRFEWSRNLRMTRQEVKDETRESEGDPLVRSRIKTLQRQMARQRMMAAVPQADVVVTNPTHIAVALRYDQRAMKAPVVVAKGAELLAERIKEVAREHGIMIVEQPMVARSLYKLVRIGQEIPADLYRAVAEILALVYRAKGLRVGTT
ncbi:Flagellar biosynthetic protein FlhB [Nitrospira tepida]|uniref:Flagellar biosynthetic protein FlhB n=1 Tax=Nitrospira tepida TaxID=2973512 RepID=A0AA86N200_9BACT|nr:flagellar biosynthesis protein FlhB [Nitrospira tepida]CAI4033006.1 Flagellar biosynthetic protein FlhB [Nitrospira tepida]